jgi:hypothetical protein
MVWLLKSNEDPEQKQVKAEATWFRRMEVEDDEAGALLNNWQCTKMLRPEEALNLLLVVVV